MKDFFRWCKRYVSITSMFVAAFVVYTLLLQDNSLFRHMQYAHTIDSLNVEIKQYTDTLEYYHRMNSLLSTDRSVMERVVREQYNMRREGEDVFIFE